MNFLGLFNFSAPYLPYVLVGFSVLLNSSWPTGDLVGIAVGHAYYYAEDVWPRVSGRQGGRTLGAPFFFKKALEIFGIRDEADNLYLRTEGQGEGGVGTEARVGEGEGEGLQQQEEQFGDEGQAAPMAGEEYQQQGQEQPADEGDARWRGGYRLGDRE